MYREELQQIGLSKNEAKIYEALVGFGQESISSITSAGKVNRRNVYDSIKKLQKKDLIIELEDIYQAKKVKDKATIYKGIEGFKNYLQDILDVGEDVYCLGAKGGWGNPALGEFGDWFIKERVRKKIKVYNLFDQSMKEKITGNKLLYDLLSEQRFLHKDYSTDSAIDIFGDQVVTFTGLSPEKFDEDVTLFVMQSKDIAESWKTWFKFLWDNSK